MLTGRVTTVLNWVALRSFANTLSTSATRTVLKIDVQEEGDTTVVQVVEVKDNDTRKVRYSDVLILEQFMREDGTVLPKELTGLCAKQQLRIERCVMQAHWAGLFPDKTIADFDRSGYRRFSRYWKDDMDMYRMKEKVEDGSWYYIKRYNPKSPKYK